jgi:hypothetical protein
MMVDHCSGEDAEVGKKNRQPTKHRDSSKLRKRPHSPTSSKEDDYSDSNWSKVMKRLKHGTGKSHSAKVALAQRRKLNDGTFEVDMGKLERWKAKIK